METIENLLYYFPSLYIEHNLQFLNYVESVASVTEHTTSLAIILFTLDEKKVTYYRTYSNICNILGDIEGLFSLCLILTSFIGSPLTELF